MNQDEQKIQEIFAKIPSDRQEAFAKLNKVILQNLPAGFELGISYGGLGYVIPHSKYPEGYHCKPSEPLPFAGITSQKNSINFYHMGLYVDAALLEWFVGEYPKYCKRKLDMGKSVIRFKKMEDIPYELIGELMTKISADRWINLYETKLKK